MRPEKQSGARRSGPLWLLLACLLPLAIFLALLFRPANTTEVPVPEVADPEQTVEALLAEVTAADGSRLIARLTPLHADPDRQAFEQQALGRRLDLGEGAPWRLSLEWRTRPADGDTRGAESASGRFTGNGPARGEAISAAMASLGLGPVQVEDGLGPALESISPPSDGATDPLRTLFAPPSGALRPGQAVDWVLWGRAPGAGARLVGLLPPPDAAEAAEFEAATGLRGPLVFAPRSVLRRELQLPLAQVDRPELEAAGKNGSPGASQGR